MTVEERRAANLERVRRYRARHPERVVQANADYRVRHGERLRRRDNAKREQDVEGARATERQRARARGGPSKSKPEHVRARREVRNALRRGEMVKPSACPECGEPTPSRRMHAHHSDYSRPLDVEWKCSTCHGRSHRKEAS